MTAAPACEGCDTAQARIVQATPLVVPAPWKALADHARLRPLAPASDLGGVLFCERCDRLWLVGWDQYGAYYMIDPLDAAYTTLFEQPPPSLARVWPLLARADPGRGLVSVFLGRANVDGSDAARMIVDAFGARDLTYLRALHLFNDLHAVLGNPRVGRGPRPAVRLDDAGPLVKLLGREELTRETGNPTGAQGELREAMTRLVRTMFGSAFDPGVPDYVAVPGRARSQLLRETGPPQPDRPGHGAER